GRGDAQPGELLPIVVVTAYLLAYALGDGFYLRLWQLRADAAMQEDRVAHLRHRRLGAQPLAILSRRRKCFTMLEVPGWVLAHPFSLDFRRLGRSRLLQRLRASLPPIQPLPIGGLPPLFRILGGKARKILWRYVAQVARDVHDLVISQQDQHAAAGLLGLLFQRHKQVHDLARAWAAVEIIAGLHQRGISSRPLLLLVYQAGLLEDLDESVEVSVDIANCHC